MTKKNATRLRWAGRVLVLLSTLAGILGAAKVAPVALRDWAGIAVLVLMAGARWCEQYLPPARGDAAGGRWPGGRVDEDAAMPRTSP